MGLLSFGRDVGRRLGFGAKRDGDDADVAVQAKSDADILRKEISDLGLDADGVEVSVSGDRVKVSGAAASQEVREKIALAVGNVEGVAEVDDAITVAAAAPESTFHTVAKGDTLWAIAKTHYGDGNQYNAIFEANKPMLAHPDKIYPGQMLRIPPKG